jgi:hypothetical protein
MPDRARFERDMLDAKIAALRAFHIAGTVPKQRIVAEAEALAADPRADAQQKARLLALAESAKGEAGEVSRN